MTPNRPACIPALWGSARKSFGGLAATDGERFRFKISSTDQTRHRNIFWVETMFFMTFLEFVLPAAKEVGKN